MLVSVHDCYMCTSPSCDLHYRCLHMRCIQLLIPLIHLENARNILWWFIRSFHKLFRVCTLPNFQSLIWILHSFVNMQIWFVIPRNRESFPTYLEEEQLRLPLKCWRILFVEDRNEIREFKWFICAIQKFCLLKEHAVSTLFLWLDPFCATVGRQCNYQTLIVIILFFCNYKQI